MKILLDTHILLWALSNDDRLSKKARRIIENPENDIYYSIVSLWEVELKKIAHPDLMPLCAKELAEYCEQCGFNKLPIKDKHIYILSDLKRGETEPTHKDPFDRMLICQASSENMMLITHDSLLSGYNEPCVLIV